MRGTGEPVFECDFLPGSDIMGEIRSGPKAGERMEFELFSRLFPAQACTGYNVRGLSPPAPSTPDAAAIMR